MTEHKFLRRTVFAAYCLLMVYLLFLQRGRSPIFGGGYVNTMLANLNLQPGAEIRRFLRVWNDPLYHRAAVVNLVGNVVMSSGIVVLAVFVGLGVWAFIDFNGLFTMFHQVFFAQGNWTFPYDSLLICALPTEFWIGMGVIWLIVAVLISILSIAIGARLRK